MEFINYFFDVYMMDIVFWVLWTLCMTLLMLLIFSRQIVLHFISKNEKEVQWYGFLLLLFFKNKRFEPGELVWRNRSDRKKIIYLGYSYSRYRKIHTRYRYRLIVAGKQDRNFIVEGGKIKFVKHENL